REGAGPRQRLRRRWPRRQEPGRARGRRDRRRRVAAPAEGGDEPRGEGDEREREQQAKPAPPGVGALTAGTRCPPWGRRRRHREDRTGLLPFEQLPVSSVPDFSLAPIIYLLPDVQRERPVRLGPFPRRRSEENHGSRPVTIGGV